MKSARETATSSGTIRVGVDTGGTFTDFVYTVNGGLHILKLPSTPANPAQAIIDGLKQIAGATGARLDKLEVVHGTTVGTNALLQRRGAKTALITTAGFEDVLVIGRQARPELYNLDATRPPSLVPDDLRLGISERVAATGEVLQPLDKSGLKKLVTRLEKEKVESIAICLLFSFVHPEHEQIIAAALKSLNVPLSISHEILPEYREYERTSTVVINAYLQPLMGTYLAALAKKVKRLRVMQSSGGSISASAAAREPVRTILSGPAGGVVGAMRAARAAGFQNLITFDMGGTSTDVALCDRAGLRLTNEAVVNQMPVAISVMDIHTVGAGGGSIARVDEGGSLRVGPESAGADPGPACYGKSALPTVTDAHAVLGHFAGGGLLGGKFPLAVEKAEIALAKLAQQISKVTRRPVSSIAAAQGVLDVVNTNMERALRRISVERGYDPREFVLIPFGGAGGLHAVDLAKALGIKRVVLPASAGALSAIGVIAADVVREESQTLMLPVSSRINRTLDSSFRAMEKSAASVLTREGFARGRQRHERFLSMRYQGQSFELEVKWQKGDLAKIFHRIHLARYGYLQLDNTVEIVTARLRSHGLVRPIPNRRSRKGKTSAQPSSHIHAYFAGRRKRTAVFSREELASGNKLKGPAIVTEYSATTLVPPGASAEVDSFGNLIVGGW